MGGSVVLVQVKNTKNDVAYVPLGLVSLVGYVGQAGWEGRVVDLRYQTEGDLVGVVEQMEPEVVGFSMLTGQGILDVVRLCKMVKSKFGVRTVVGGMHPTLLPEQTVECEWIDQVVVNDGEEGLLRVLEGERGRVVDGGRLDLGTLPDLPWGEWVREYDKRLGGVNVYTTKGCPFPCAFCYNTKAKKKYRVRSLSGVRHDVRELRGFGVRHLIVHDDNFVVDRGWTSSVVRVFKEFGMEFSINIRIDSISTGLMEELVDGGLREVRIGCESGSDRVLREVVDKGISPEDIERGVGVCKDFGVKALLSFVIGWPGESVEERQATVRLAVKLRDSWDGVSVYPLWIYNPYPGTRLGRKAVELGWEEPEGLEEWGKSYWGRANLPWIQGREKREYEDLHTMSRVAWYNRRSLVRRGLRWIATKRIVSGVWKGGVDVWVIKVVMRVYQWWKRSGLRGFVGKG